jgi:flagellar motor component MotA
MRTIGYWAAILVFVGAGIVLEGGHLSAYFQFTSALLVLFPTFSYLLFRCGLIGTFEFLKRLVSGKTSPADNVHIEMVATLGFLFGAIGSIIGMVHVMENLTDTTRLGAGVAVAFITAFYGAVPAIILFPLKSTNSEHAASQNSGSHLKKAAGFMMMTFFMLGTSLAAVLYATAK